MKALKVNISIGLITLMLLCVAFKPMTHQVTGKKVKQTDKVNYQDGIYEGKSQDGYAGMEPFWGIVRIKVEKGVFTSVNFMIRDTSIHECVDSVYGINHYASYPAYQVQCVKDGNGIKTYPKKLLQTQDISKVDATSGATWSYNIFKASVKDALLTNQSGVSKGK
jgi:major membrane immunogen (membrane-anchored lipoprotein)